MAATCALCPRSAEITAAMAVPGATTRSAAAAIGTSKTSLLRHLAHTGTPVQAPAAVQPGPVVQAPVQASAPVAAPASPVAASPVKVGPVGGQSCVTCSSPHRAAIEAALARGLGYRPIERLFKADGGPSDSSIAYHAVKCCPEALATAADARASRAAATATKAAEWMDTLLHRSEALLDRAEAAGSIGESTAAFRELRSTVADLAKITGEVSANVEIRVTQSQSYAAFKGIVAATLAPWPDALAALGAALTAAEAT